MLSHGSSHKESAADRDNLSVVKSGRLRRVMVPLHAGRDGTPMSNHLQDPRLHGVAKGRFHLNADPQEET